MIEKMLSKTKFKVIVKPDSKKNEITGFDEKQDAVKISIAAPADKNKANKELIKFLSRKLKKKVRIASGFSSKIKTVTTT